MSSGLIPVKERSIRTTDSVALNLFRQLRRMTAADRRFVLSALDSRIGGALDERVVAVRSAIELFRLETGEPLSKRKYERWRVSRADSRGLPSATFIVNTWPGASWSRAMDQLEFQPGPDHAARRMALAGAYRSDEELVEHLRECAADLGRTSRVSEYDAWQREKVRSGNGRYLGVQTYRNRFGDWPQAMVTAGLPFDGRREPRTTLREWESGQPF